MPPRLCFLTATRKEQHKVSERERERALCLCLEFSCNGATMAESVAARAPAVMWLISLCFAVHHLSPVAEAIWITLPSSGTKCVSEEIHSNVVVVGDYVVVNVDAHGNSPRDHHDAASHHTPTVSTKVTSPYGNNLHHQENVTHGQFAFTTKEGGNYLACFWVNSNHHGGADVTVNLEWRTGIAAKDWDSVAKKEKIEGLELELVKLEGLVDSIHANLLYLKSREAEMREVSEKTNARVAWFSIMSLGICILAALWQTWHLQGFFQKKKLI